MSFSVDGARDFLNAANVFFSGLEQTLNMNDVWCWACADGEKVPDEALPRVAELFWRYGWAGILYWVSQQNDGLRSEFHHYNRMIDFVANEERIKHGKSQSEYAYCEESYSLGGERAN